MLASGRARDHRAGAHAQGRIAGLVVVAESPPARPRRHHHRAADPQPRRHRPQAAGDEIAEGRRRLNDAMEHMADGLVMFDKEARIVLCNDQYRDDVSADRRDARSRRAAGGYPARLGRARRTDRHRARRNRRVDSDTCSADFTQPGETDIQMGDGRWLRARVRPTADGGSSDCDDRCHRRASTPRPS